MNPLSLSNLARIVRGSAPPGGDTLVTAVGHDTRDLTPGSLFFAIVGDAHDGHDHLTAATAAAAAVVRTGTPPVPGLPLIHVDDTRLALGRLAAEVRKSLRGKVVAVAGSNGKTGTKNLIHTALTGVRRGSASPKSFNNDIGVPTTILAADPADDYLILELGTNHPDEILTLTRIARPDVGVITSIGEEHLEFLTDLDGVRRENAELVRGLTPGGVLLATGDDAPLRDMIPAFDGRTIRFGLDESCDVRAVDVVGDRAGVRFGLSDTGAAVAVPLLGRHNASNALAAILVARQLGVDDATSIANLADAVAVPQRLQLQRAGGVTILNDAYNANPHSMRAALRTIRETDHAGRKMAVLGDMLELGDAADKYHDEIGTLAAASGLDGLICVGTRAKRIAAAAVAAAMPAAGVHHFPDAAACAALIGQSIRSGDLVLLKASHGVRLQRVADAILDAHRG